MIQSIWKNKQLRKKILLTLVILFIIAGLSGVPTPGINRDYFKELLSANTGLALFNMLAGNGLGNASITMLSITPYITASIILQLLTVVFPSLHEIQRDGQTGQDLFKKYTMLLGVALALIQALGFSIGFGRQGLLISYKWYWVLCTTLIWTLIAFLLMVAGEFIEKKGFGNGISLILLFNILSSYPSDAQTVFDKFFRDQTIGNIVIHGVVVAALIIGLFAFVIFIQETEKRIVVRYSAKVTGKVQSGSNVFPIKLCPGSVVPIIFASSLMSMPALIAQLFGKEFWLSNMLNSSNWFNSDHPWYSIGVVIYVLLIFVFSYFYTDLILNPLEIANNFKKSGGMIPGVRPGQPTVDYIKKQMNITILVGAAALSLVALVPCVLSGIFGISRLAFAGSSIIITAGVILETYNSLSAETKVQSLRLF